MADLASRVERLGEHDRRRLGRRLDAARRRQSGGADHSGLERLRQEVEAAEERLERRRASVPVCRYPEDLPITARREELAAAITGNQVVIVAGETGSGKTTQLPKICLESGRGVRGLIGHTQPRRIAARSVAERIAEELGTPLGGLVGYTVRFTDRVSAASLVKVMTDGILLAEIGRDRLLSRYDTLIIDEAHERSLNIDFILGYLKRLLPERPDLKVIITSATIDTGRFAAHFGGAPVVEVSGRGYPVEIRYRPLDEDPDDGDLDDGDLDDGDLDDEAGEPFAPDPFSNSRGAGAARGGRITSAARGGRITSAARGDGDPPVRDQVQGICDAVEELRREGPGDILVFLSGEREITDAAEALSRQVGDEIEIVPLYARLSAAEQHRVFEAHRGRRIVLATNVAETSLTVPGIRYVIDAGTARISRYSRRTKVQRLPIEPVSQASANQRAGRCGRLGPGICIRLYSERDFRQRPDFTDPEILRTNLASVILQMMALGLGDVAAFPFLDPPDNRNIRDGIALLDELGALEPGDGGRHRRLSALGRRLARLPIDPRLGRMILEAGVQGCAAEVLVIASALCIRDVREYPTEQRQAAAESHSRFADGQSDFLSYLKLWQYLTERQAELSSTQFRKLCRAEFLNYLRVREWQDLHGQLTQIADELGITTAEGPPPAGGAGSKGATDRTTQADRVRADRIHMALLAGLLSHIGVRDAESGQYLGARNARFAIFASSGLAKRQPRWVMAAELVETGRLWARGVARIQPEWAEQLGGHLLKRSHGEPWWDPDRGAAMTTERVTLYGLPVIARRNVNLSTVDPAGARELFIRHALVAGEWHTHHRFWHHNRELLEQVASLGDRVRRSDLAVDEQAQFDFYDARLPATVTSGRHFDRWWKRAKRDDEALLDFTEEMLFGPAAGLRRSDFPDTWHHDGLELRLDYAFTPGDELDGVTVHIPLPVLNRVSAGGFDWQVPGLREELVVALIRTLPKPIRRNFIPAPDFARAFLDRAAPPDGPLVECLLRVLPQLAGCPIPPGSFGVAQLPDHLRMTFAVVDSRDRLLASSKDLDALKQRLGGYVSASIAAASGPIERAGLRAWTFGTLPRRVEPDWRGHTLRGYPALVDEGDSVAIRVLPTEADQQEAMWAGTRRLLAIAANGPTRLPQRQLSTATKLALTAAPHGDLDELFDDCRTCALDQLIAAAGGPVWDADAFAALSRSVNAALSRTVLDLVGTVGELLASVQRIRHRLAALQAPVYREARDDMEDQLDGLVYPGFVSATGALRLPHLRRYLAAMEQRLDRLAAEPARDRARMRRIGSLLSEYRGLRASTPDARQALGEISWMIEELRVSYFAQQLGTAAPVSDERIRRRIRQLAS